MGFTLRVEKRFPMKIHLNCEAGKVLTTLKGSDGEDDATKLRFRGEKRVGLS